MRFEKVFVVDVIKGLVCNFKRKLRRVFLVLNFL